MRPSGRTATTTTAALHGAGRGRFVPAHARSENRQLLLQLGGAAMGALRPLPTRGTHQDFAIFFTTTAMKLVYRHGGKIADIRKSSSAGNRFRILCGRNLERRFSIGFGRRTRNWRTIAVRICKSCFIARSKPAASRRCGARMRASALQSKLAAQVRRPIISGLSKSLVPAMISIGDE